MPKKPAPDDPGGARPSYGGKTITRIATILLIVLSASVASAQTFRTLPDRFLTPGWTVDGITLHTVCTTKWGQDARAVTAKKKQDGMDACRFDVKMCPLSNFRKKRVRRVEIDHLVPRSLGGADDERNPLAAVLRADEEEKKPAGWRRTQEGSAETFLHRDVCAKQSV